MFARAWGGSLNKHETTHFQPSGNEWFFAFVYTDALLAIISLTPLQPEKQSVKRFLPELK